MRLDEWHTLLSWACASNKPRSAEALIAKGADVNAENQGGGTALHFAASNCPAAVPMLLAKGADVEAVSGGMEDRPLHLAKNAAVARALVAAGADLNPENCFGETPVVKAGCESRGGAAQFLLKQPGTDLVAARDRFGRSLLHQAVRGGLDVRPHTVADYEGPPLGSYEVVRLLLPHYEDVTIFDRALKTPLDECRAFSSDDAECKQSKQGIAIALLEARADIQDVYEVQLLQVLRPFLVELYRNPTAPLPAYRRTLRWAMTSRVVEAALPSIRAEAAVAATASDSASVSAGAGGAAALTADIEDTKTLRLSLFHQDAWKRRGHLVFDRAMTIKEAELEQAAQHSTAADKK